MLIFGLAIKLTKTPTIHTVTFGVAHIETGSLHVCRKNIPPFILVTQGGLSACWTLLTCCGESTMKNTFRNPHRAKKGKNCCKACNINQSSQYVSSHQSRSQVGMVSRWLCHCYRNQGYRGGRALGLHLEATAQLQPHPPGIS